MRTRRYTAPPCAAFQPSTLTPWRIPSTTSSARIGSVSRSTYSEIRHAPGARGLLVAGMNGSCAVRFEIGVILGTRNASAATRKRFQNLFWN